MTNPTHDHVSRSDNTQLPGHDELARILVREVYRPLPASNEELHFTDYDSIVRLLKNLGLPVSIFTQPLPDIYAAVAAGDALVEQAVPLITASQPDAAQQALLDNVYDYLAEEDEPQAVDLIFVFGGKTPERALTAAHLYSQQWAPKILVSGGSPIYAPEAVPEALRYQGILLENGVKGADIVVEKTSITIPDNVRVSLNMLEQTGQVPHSLILVNSPYAQRRGWAIMKKHLPAEINVYRVNCLTKPEYSRGEWYKQSATCKIILNEFFKLRASEIYNTA